MTLDDLIKSCEFTKGRDYRALDCSCGETTGIFRIVCPKVQFDAIVHRWPRSDYFIQELAHKIIDGRHLVCFDIEKKPTGTPPHSMGWFESVGR